MAYVVVMAGSRGTTGRMVPSKEEQLSAKGYRSHTANLCQCRVRVMAVVQTLGWANPKCHV